MSNQQAFIRFKEVLETRQLAHDPERDIREHLLSLSSGKIGFGYVAKGLNVNFGANIRNVFEQAVAADEPEISTVDACVLFGTIFQQADHSHKGGTRMLNAVPPTTEILFGEACFLATSHSWAHSFQQSNPAYACLGYVYDDIAHYFMADYPNRLIQKLNSDETPSAQELARAETLLARIVSQRISKYNAQPMVAPAMTDGYKRRVLVCDQAWLCCTNRVRDSSRESRVVAGMHEQTHTPDLQDQELASLQ